MRGPIASIPNPVPDVAIPLARTRLSLKDRWTAISPAVSMVWKPIPVTWKFEEYIVQCIALSTDGAALKTKITKVKTPGFRF